MREFLFDALMVTLVFGPMLYIIIMIHAIIPLVPTRWRMWQVIGLMLLLMVPAVAVLAFTAFHVPEIQLAYDLAWIALT